MTLPTVTHQAPLSMGFPQQEYWSRLPFPPAGHLPDPGIEPQSPASSILQADSLSSEPPGKPEIMVRNSLKVHIEIFVDKMICLGII